MDEEIEAAGKRYVAELLGFHPEIEAELVAPEGGIADATVRIKSPSRQGIRGIMDTVARLTTKYFEDTGYYFQASADYDGPVLFGLERQYLINLALMFRLTPTDCLLTEY